MNAIDIEKQLELFVDEYLIEEMGGEARLTLNNPVQQEVALVTDAPWEGNMCVYITVFKDEERYRMYFQANNCDISGGELRFTHDLLVSYAESVDGINWTKPCLGIYEFERSKENSIVWRGGNGRGVHVFSPFKDSNPEAPPEALYKPVGAIREAGKAGLYAMVSPDGYRWRFLRDEPIITRGAFDSQNLAFWDPVRKEYRAYIRDFKENRRDIKTATSKDFVEWSEPQWLEYPGAPDEQLYTNGIIPYYRAPHIFLGFPTRYTEREWSSAIEALRELEHRRLRAKAHKRYGTALTDGLLMSSRDGRTFKRWDRAFIRPGAQLEGNWVYGDNYQCWGMLETESSIPGAPPELGFYVTEGYWRGMSTIFRRYTLRIDGFVSVRTPLSGGELMTKPLIFSGQTLVVNFATSAGGSMRVEIQDKGGRAIPGFSLRECVELIGDELERKVSWSGDSDLSTLTNKPVRLRFWMSDADLYSLRFA